MATSLLELDDEKFSDINLFTLLEDLPAGSLAKHIAKAPKDQMPRTLQLAIRAEEVMGRNVTSGQKVSTFFSVAGNRLQDETVSSDSEDSADEEGEDAEEKRLRRLARRGRNLERSQRRVLITQAKAAAAQQRKDKAKEKILKEARKTAAQGVPAKPATSTPDPTRGAPRGRGGCRGGRGARGGASRVGRADGAGHRGGRGRGRGDARGGRGGRGRGGHAEGSKRTIKPDKPPGNVWQMPFQDILRSDTLLGELVRRIYKEEKEKADAAEAQRKKEEQDALALAAAKKAAEAEAARQREAELRKFREVELAKKEEEEAAEKKLSAERKLHEEQEQKKTLQAPEEKKVSRHRRERKPASPPSGLFTPAAASSGWDVAEDWSAAPAADWGDPVPAPPPVPKLLDIARADMVGAIDFSSWPLLVSAEPKRPSANHRNRGRGRPRRDSHHSEDDESENDEEPASDEEAEDYFDPSEGDSTVPSYRCDECSNFAASDLQASISHTNAHTADFRGEALIAFAEHAVTGVPGLAYCHEAQVFFDEEDVEARPCGCRPGACKPLTHTPHREEGKLVASAHVSRNRRQPGHGSWEPVEGSDDESRPGAPQRGRGRGRGGRGRGGPQRSFAREEEDQRDVTAAEYFSAHRSLLLAEPTVFRNKTVLEPFWPQPSGRPAFIARPRIFFRPPPLWGPTGRKAERRLLRQHAEVELPDMMS